MNPHDAAFPRAPVLNEFGRPFCAAQDGMSLREYAAITLKVPTSGTKWLDDMILTSQFQAYATTALAALIPVMHGGGLVGSGVIADEAFEFAAEMMLGSKHQGENNTTPVTTAEIFPDQDPV